MQTFKAQLKIPLTVYEKDETTSIRSLLGNDVEIISYSKNDIILPNDFYLIDVEYSMIDINPFKFYKIENVKRLNLNSDKYIAEVEGKLVKLSLQSQKKNFWVKLDSCKQEASADDEIKIMYYGLEVENMNDVLHSFCTIFGTKNLSYHGTTVKHSLDENIILKDVVGKTRKIDINIETDAYLNLSSISHDYATNYYDLTYFKTSDINKLKLTTLDELLKSNNDDVVIIDLTLETPKSMKSKIMKLEHGIFLLSNDRSSPLSTIYVRNSAIKLTESIIDILINVVCLDIENVVLTNLSK